MLLCLNSTKLTFHSYKMFTTTTSMGRLEDILKVCLHVMIGPRECHLFSFFLANIVQQRSRKKTSFVQCTLIFIMEETNIFGELVNFMDPLQLDYKSWHIGFNMQAEKIFYAKFNCVLRQTFHFYLIKQKNCRLQLL